jgi:hypothetical protein
MDSHAIVDIPHSLELFSVSDRVVFDRPALHHEAVHSSEFRDDLLGGGKALRNTFGVPERGRVGVGVSHSRLLATLPHAKRNSSGVTCFPSRMFQERVEESTH